MTPNFTEFGAEGSANSWAVTLHQCGDDEEQRRQEPGGARLSGISILAFSTRTTPSTSYTPAQVGRVGSGTRGNVDSLTILRYRVDTLYVKVG